MRTLLAALVLLLTAGAAAAVEPREKLADPTQEARARDVSSGLRCLVCQNESIDESGAELAHDIRVFVRERITAGDSNRQVVDAVVGRYGSFVLLKPPVEPATYLLWFGPPVLVLAGLAGTFVWVRRRRTAGPAAEPAPLSAEEQKRLQGLLKDHDG